MRPSPSGASGAIFADAEHDPPHSFSPLGYVRPRTALALTLFLSPLRHADDVCCSFFTWP